MITAYITICFIFLSTFQNVSCFIVPIRNSPQITFTRGRSDVSIHPSKPSPLVYDNRDTYNIEQITRITRLQARPSNREQDNTIESCHQESMSQTSSAAANESITMKPFDKRISALVTAGIFTSLFFFLSGDVSHALPFEAPRFTLLQINENWSRYFIAGGIGSAISHTVSVPFDVVKTKKQAVPELSELGVVKAFQKIVADEGLSVLLKGLVPTLIGYFIHGSFKYGFYELFKPIVASLLHDSAGPVLGSSHFLCLMIAGILAEFIGSFSLVPFEAARIKLVANPEYASNLLSSLIKTSQIGGFMSLFSSFPMMLAKHLPYTAVQLSIYETITATIYGTLESYGVTDVYSYHYAVSFIAASVAAFLSTLASQPGDTLMTVINKSQAAATVAGISVSATASASENIAVTMWKTATSLGFRGLYVGTAARLLHISIIVVVQLLVYDYIKELCGLPITGMSH
jgi:solute carrier family 25 (mitochondrial phosphate transporter), member 3